MSTSCALRPRPTVIPCVTDAGTVTGGRQPAARIHGAQRSNATGRAGRPVSRDPLRAGEPPERGLYERWKAGHDRTIDHVTTVPPPGTPEPGTPEPGTPEPGTPGIRRRYLSPGAWRPLVRGLAPGLCFAGLILAVAAAGQTRSAATQEAWQAWASTNLDNLHHRPLAALVASPFLPDGYTLLWSGLSLLGLSAAGRVLGEARTVVLAVTAHVVGTLVSQGFLASRIASGSVPPEARHMIDVGPSYVAVSALVATIAYGTWPGRLLAAAGFAVVGPSLFSGLGDWGVAETGHVCAVVVGLVLGFLLRRSAGGWAWAWRWPLGKRS